MLSLDVKRLTCILSLWWLFDKIWYGAVYIILLSVPFHVNHLYIRGFFEIFLLRTRSQSVATCEGIVTGSWTGPTWCREIVCPSRFGEGFNETPFKESRGRKTPLLWSLSTSLLQVLRSLSSHSLLFVSHFSFPLHWCVTVRRRRQSRQRHMRHFWGVTGVWHPLLCHVPLSLCPLYLISLFALSPLSLSFPFPSTQVPQRCTLRCVVGDEVRRRWCFWGAMGRIHPLLFHV